MQVLLINPSKKKKTKAKSKKNSKRGAAMAKKKKTRRKTVAKRNPSTPKRRRRRAVARVRRRKIRTRRNPSMNPIAYAIGGATGLATSKVIDTIKPISLPMGITAGNVASVALGYLMYKKGTGTIRQIGTGHLASSLGLLTINLLDGITGGKVLGGGLHGLDEYVIDEATGEIIPAQVLDGLEAYEPDIPVQVLDGMEEMPVQMIR